MPLYLAQYAYGVENTTFNRPRYVPEGYCEWCGGKLKSKRQTSCCCEDCRSKFNTATSSVYYANHGSASGYRNQIFRRDNYTCQECGEAHRLVNENGIELPTTDGHLELHHKKPRTLGGDDNPNNLETICDICHKEETKKLMEILHDRG